MGTGTGGSGVARGGGGLVKALLVALVVVLVAALVVLLMVALVTLLMAP